MGIKLKKRNERHCKTLRNTYLRNTCNFALWRWQEDVTVVANISMPQLPYIKTLIVACGGLARCPSLHAAEVRLWRWRLPRWTRPCLNPKWIINCSRPSFSVNAACVADSTTRFTINATWIGKISAWWAPRCPPHICFTRSMWQAIIPSVHNNSLVIQLNVTWCFSQKWSYNHSFHLVIFRITKTTTRHRERRTFHFKRSKR